MHCPYCNADLTDGESREFRCSASGAWFSRSVSDQIRQWFAGATSRSVGAESVRTGEWFCPGCGVPATDLSRAQCGGTLRDLKYELVEVNSHVG